MHATWLGAKSSGVKGKTCHGLILLSELHRVKVREYLCRVSPRRDEALLFRQTCPNPFLPVRSPSGAWSTAPNQDDSETPFEVQGHLFGQTVLAREVGFGAAAQPRPTWEMKGKGKQRKSLFVILSQRRRICIFPGAWFTEWSFADACCPMRDSSLCSE